MNASDHPPLAAQIGAARSSRRRWFWPAVALALGAGAGTLWLVQNGRRDTSAMAPEFITEPLQRGTIGMAITATGNLEPTNEVTVGSELSGTILEVYVETNDLVTKGQALAKLDPTRLTQESNSSRASLRSAEANLAQAQATQEETEAEWTRLTRLRELSGGQLPSPAELDAAKAAVARAKASVQVAEAAVGEAEAKLGVNLSDLEKAVIRSPINGIVLTRDVDPGQTVAASFSAPELFVIAESLEHMKLLVAVAEADIGRLERDQEATFTVDAWPDRNYKATVQKVSYGSSVTDNVVTYDTELSVANADGSLRPGMTATADIQVATHENTFVVPAAALRFEPTPPEGGPGGQPPAERSFLESLTPRPPRPPARSAGSTERPPEAGVGSSVWVLEEGRPHPVPVTIGLSDGNRIEITSGELVEGLAVILRER